MKKLLSLLMIMSSIVAMEQKVEGQKPNNFNITWKEIILISRELHQYSGDRLDVHPLIWAELNKPLTLELQDSGIMVIGSASPLKRRNTNEKIRDGINSVRDKLLGIRKISSSP